MRCKCSYYEKSANRLATGGRVSIPKQSVNRVIARNPEPGRRGRSNLKQVRKDKIASIFFSNFAMTHNGGVVCQSRDSV